MIDVFGWRIHAVFERYWYFLLWSESWFFYFFCDHQQIESESEEGKRDDDAQHGSMSHNEEHEGDSLCGVESDYEL